MPQEQVRRSGVHRTPLASLEALIHAPFGVVAQAAGRPQTREIVAQHLMRVAQLEGHHPSLVRSNDCLGAWRHMAIGLGLTGPASLEPTRIAKALRESDGIWVVLVPELGTVGKQILANLETSLRTTEAHEGADGNRAQVRVLVLCEGQLGCERGFQLADQLEGPDRQRFIDVLVAAREVRDRKRLADLGQNCALDIEAALGAEVATPLATDAACASELLAWTGGGVTRQFALAFAPAACWNELVERNLAAPYGAGGFAPRDLPRRETLNAAATARLAKVPSALYDCWIAARLASTLLRTPAATEDASVGDRVEQLVHDALRLASSHAARRDLLRLWQSDCFGVELKTSIGQVLLSAGDCTAARGVLEECLTQIERPELRRQATAAYVEALVELGEEVLANAALDTVRDQLDATRRMLLEARLHYAGGRYQEALDVASSDVLKSSRWNGDAANVCGKVLLAQKRWNDAEAHFAGAETQALQLGTQTEVLRARTNRAIAVSQQGRHNEARAIFQAVRSCGLRDHSDRAVSISVSNLAALAVTNQDFSSAGELLLDAVDRAQALGDDLHTARCLLNLADFRIITGRCGLAAQAIRLAKALHQDRLPPRLLALERVVQARLHLAAEDTASAAACLQEGLLAAHRSDNGSKLGTVYRLMTRAALVDGDVDRARDALAHAEQQSDMPSHRAECALLLAEIQRAHTGEYEREAEIALEIAQTAGLAEQLLRAHFLCEEAAAAKGNSERQSHHRRVVDGLVETLTSGLDEQSSDGYRQRLMGMRSRPSMVGPTKLVAAPQPATADSDVNSDDLNGDAAKDAHKHRQELVGDSVAMAKLRDSISRIAKTDATVLVLGESGTGKELVADALHHQSNRHEAPLVKVNCGALVETLLLSELFGHERGAFTGAERRRVGRFEQADGGTIFLDEIGDISPKTQVALLRVLQEQTFQRVGGGETITTNVRVICATHRDLASMVAEGTFREDLYYRLCGITVGVPSLRDRLEDLAMLGDELLSRIQARHGLPTARLSNSAIRLLEQHTWPGNVRELENALRATTLFVETDTIESIDLREHVAALGAHPTLPPPSSYTRSTMAPSGMGLVSNVEEMVFLAVKEGRGLPEMKRALERFCIERALEETDGNITQAAKLLGMKRPRVSQLVSSYSRKDKASA